MGAVVGLVALRVYVGVVGEMVALRDFVGMGHAERERHRGHHMASSEARRRRRRVGTGRAADNHDKLGYVYCGTHLFRSFFGRPCVLDLVLR